MLVTANTQESFMNETAESLIYDWNVSGEKPARPSLNRGPCYAAPAVNVRRIRPELQL